MTETTESDMALNRCLPFMLLMALAVGVVAGFGAWAFRMLIGLVHNVLFLGKFSVDYDANVFTPANPWGIGIVLVPVIGALGVAWLVKNFAPEAKGHGVPEVMDAIYYKQGLIRPRVALVKSLASAISIGSGGSVGREGPIVQIGSAFGSTLGTLIRMRLSDRVTLIAAGAGAGIAATFNAPLGGIVFALELLLVSLNARNMLVVTIASAVATYIGRWMLGADPSFYIPALESPDFHLNHPWVLALFVILGVLLGVISVAFIRGLYKMEDLFEALPGNYYTRHVLGMLCLGVMMYLLMRQTGHYYIEGVGYATIMEILKGSLVSPWFLLLLAALKLLATCLSLGSGASGGVFSPALFMGATAGAAFGHLCQATVPGMEMGIPVFAIAGMAAAISGTTGAVLTSIIMLSEMTMDYSITLPLVITCFVAYTVRKWIMNESIYTMKLLSRGHSVPEGLHASNLYSKRTQDLMTRDFAVFPNDGELAADAKYVIQSESGLISSVTKRQADGGDERSLRYVVVPQGEKLIATAGALWNTEAEIVLVARERDSRRAEDLIGVITQETLAKLFKTEGELSG